MKSIAITFRSEQKLVIPMAHFDMLQGLCYELISYNPELSARIHDMKSIDGRNYKLTCFSDLKARYNIQDKSIVYEEPIQWEIRSMHDEIIDTVANRLHSDISFVLNGNLCTTMSAEIRENDFLQGPYKFDMLTPITVYTTDDDKHNTFFEPDNFEFVQMIERNLSRKYREFYDEEPENFRFSVISSNRKDKCVTRCHETYVTGYYGIYRLDCSPKMMALAYNAGLGAKNLQGFGTIGGLVI